VILRGTTLIHVFLHLKIITVLPEYPIYLDIHSLATFIYSSLRKVLSYYFSSLVITKYITPQVQRFQFDFIYYKTKFIFLQ